MESARVEKGGWQDTGDRGQAGEQREARPKKKKKEFNDHIELKARRNLLHPSGSRESGRDGGKSGCL